MDIYSRLIENPLFFKWIYHPGPEIEAWWKTYLDLHPEEADQILRFKGRFDALGFSIEKLNEAERKALAEKIIAGIEAIDRKKGRRSFIFGWIRYAAIALIFFAMGIVYVHMKSDKKQDSPFAQTAPVAPGNNGPVLILPEGNSIPLEKAESTLDYTNPNQIVLNNDSVIDRDSSTETSSNNQLIVPYGNRSKITLSDNTVVWLNAGSRLVYPSKFSGNKREVLLEGEAFFQVAKNEAMPFFVKTPMVEVKVFGTQFDLSAFPDDNLVQTVLKEGSVSVRKTEGGFFEKEIMLLPNQMASFDKLNKETKVTTVDASSYIIWTQGLLSFDDLEMCRVMKSLERYYNVKIHFADPEIGMQRISGKLDFNKEIEEVFEYLSKVSHTKFTKIDDHNFQIK